MSFHDLMSLPDFMNDLQDYFSGLETGFIVKMLVITTLELVLCCSIYQTLYQVS